MSRTLSAKQRNAPIIELWQRLPRLSRLDFSARPGPNSTTGWAGEGQARVQSRTGRDGVRLFEAGRFTAAGSTNSMTFRNVFRWQRVGARVSLWHERFGADAPVRLFDLIADDSDGLVSATPHHCVADIYEARLMLTEDGIALTWTILGPRKDEHLHYRYRF